MLRTLIITSLLISTNILAASFETDLVKAAIERTNFNIRYDGSYYSIGYPNGDVPDDVGVCTDLLIRAYRKIGYDVQQLVHEDMTTNFSEYPSKRIWGLSKPDKNIDHRRVPNLQSFFRRHGEVLPVSSIPKDYKPGDLVTWILAGNLPHIGIVTDQISNDTGNPFIVHNIGSGPKMEDMLFKYKITGHYRYEPKERA